MRNFLLIVIALFISLALHYITLKNINNHLSSKKLQYPTSNTKSEQKKGFTAVKYVKIVKPQEKTEQTFLKKQPPIKKEEPKQIIEKKQTVKKTIKNVNLNKNIKTLQIEKSEDKIDLKALFTKKEETEKRKIDDTSKKDIQIKKERQTIKKLDTLTQQYIKLYGEKYYAFSDEQKKYIKNNISTIGKITQKYLQYPTISARTKQSGTNIVEFKLHPNGDITDLKLIGSSNYTALDQNSINTIKIAYAEYPKPSEATWIRIYVNYILY